MPINKHALIRYYALDSCLSNHGRRYGIHDLLSACNNALKEYQSNTSGIKVRQLYEDLRYMKSSQGYSAPIETLCEARKRYYRYSSDRFSIKNDTTLNQTETNQLKEAILVLQRFKGLPQFNWIEELLPKLDQTFQLGQSKREVVGFADNKYLKGREYLSPLFNAIVNKRVQNIQYHPFRGEEIQYCLHPHYLKQFNNRWFLLGQTDEYETPTHLALDRITAVEETAIEYIDSHINFEDYFEDIIGVTIPYGGTIETITLFVDQHQAPYIKSKPIHESQTPLRDFKDGFKFTIKVIPNPELESLILSHGERLKVIAPEPLKNKIRDRIENSLYLYNN